MLNVISTHLNMYWFILFLSMNTVLTCPVPSVIDLTVQSNFSLHHFLGVWYKIKWYTHEIFQGPEIWNDYYQSFELENNSNEFLLTTGKGRPVYEDDCFAFGPWLIRANNSGRMFLEKTDITNSTNLNWPYLILKTDYDHYALIYACMSVNFTMNEQCKQPIIWVFSRKVLLSNDYLIQLDDYIEDVLCLNLTQFQIVLHSEKSCYTTGSFGMKMSGENSMIFLLPFLYLFLIYK